MNLCTRKMRPCLLAIAWLPAGICQAGNDLLYADGFEDAACAPLYPDDFDLNWDDLFSQGWPGYNQAVQFVPLPNSYFSLRFTAGPAGQFGRLEGVPMPPGTPSAGWLSISRTRGCFDAAYNGARCVSEIANIQSVYWTTGQDPLRCQLIPGETYYINLTLGRSGVTGPGPYCDRETSACIFELGQFSN